MGNSIKHTISPEFARLVELLKTGGWSGTDKVLISSSIMNFDEGKTFKLDWWQDWYIKNDFRFLIANKSRRIGWSFSTALKGMLNVLDPAKYNYTKQFVSYSMEDAKEKIAVARSFYMSIPEGFGQKRLVSDSKTSLEWEDKNGRSRSRLISWPCKAPRGKGGDISLDEFAFHAKDNLIYTAALPVISRGGNLEIGSTPFGNKGKFYDIIANKLQFPEFKCIEVMWYMSPALCTDVKTAIKVASGLPTEKMVETFGTDILKTIYANMSLEDFQQEYECSFRDELAAFITLDMIQKCTPLAGDDDDPESTKEIIPFRTIDDLIIGYRPEKHGFLYAGYDVGRTNDASELLVIGYNPETNLRQAIASISFKKTGFDAQKENLIRFMKELPVYRLAIDATGIGMNLAENLVTRFPKKVDPITFSGPVKEELANSTWLVFDKTQIALPPDRELQQQIHSIKKTVTASKNSRFDCDANEKHHADKFWALALAIHAVAGGGQARMGGFYQQYAKQQQNGKVPKTAAAVIAAARRTRL
ncbi:MAG: terminase family protein [Rectinema sp.]